MSTRHNLFLLAVTAAAACSSHPDLGKNDAIDLANRELASKLPQVLKARWQDFNPRAVDAGTSWHVVYCPPLDSTGNPFVLTVDKRTKAVADSRAKPFEIDRRYCSDAAQGTAAG